jgi:DEAD/DEAH box helicase domain-containing protein
VIFKNAVNDWRGDYEALLNAWRDISENGVGSRQASPRAQANMLHYQGRALYETTVIEAFADRQFLPRYGFPIGMQKLRVIRPDEKKPNRIREEDQYRLERSGLLALREYVPGSQLLVGGRLITSHGLLKHWTGAELDNYIGLRGRYAECQNGHTYYQIAEELGDCTICDKPAAGNPRSMLLPKHGFTSAAWDPPRLSSDVEKVGAIERATITFARGAGKADLSDDQFAGIKGLSARYREAGEILVYNAGDQNKGFAICLQCGYADSEKHMAPGELPGGFKTHARLTAVTDRFPCWGQTHTPPLRNQTLAARETTDVLLLTFSGQLGSHAKDQKLMQTLGYALQIAGARLLELDTRELGVMAAYAEEFGDGVGAVVYDNTPGGAGHVRELFTRNRDWLESAKETLFVSEIHDARCETACLDCLLTFDAQEAMHKGLLQRRITYGVLKDLLEGGATQLIGARTTTNDLLETSIDNQEQEGLSREERLARGRERRRR